MNLICEFLFRHNILHTSEVRNGTKKKKASKPLSLLAFLRKLPSGFEPLTYSLRVNRSTY